MKTYSLSQKGISQFHIKTFKRASIITFVGLIVTFYTVPIGWLPAIFLSFLAFGIVVFAMHQINNRQKEILESIQFELGDNYIAREQIRIPRICIDCEDITSIKETSYGLHVYTVDKTHSLLVTKMLDSENYQEIKNTLSLWTKIRPFSLITHIQSFTLTIVLLIALAIVFLSSIVWLVLLAGLLLIGFYGLVAWQLQRNSGIDPHFRRGFILLCIATIGIVSLKIGFLAFS